jgi:soluble lytic murein transglycosylase-like protein
LPYLAQDQIAHIAQSIVRYAQEASIDPLLVTALIYRESTFNPRAVSVTGAQGLGQIKSMNFPDLEITDAFDIAQNAKGTARYLKQMLSLWNNHPQQIEYALASYFKGHNGFRREGCTMDQKTSNYVNNIIAKYQEVKELKRTMRG